MSLLRTLGFYCQRMMLTFSLSAQCTTKIGVDLKPGVPQALQLTLFLYPYGVFCGVPLTLDY